MVKLSQVEKDLLHQYVDESKILEIIEFITGTYGDVKQIECKYKNDEAEQFDKHKLIKKIKSLIEDEDYEENLDSIISELEICYTEQNDTKGPVDEMIYCGEKVKVILESVPQIVYLRFDEQYGNTTITDYVVNNGDFDNFEIILEILKKSKKSLVNCIDTTNQSIMEKIMGYLEKNNLVKNKKFANFVKVYSDGMS